MSLWTIEQGDSPLVIDVPHAGIGVPAEIDARLTPAARALPDTDWHVDKLYAFAPQAGATLICATTARYVVDLNRDPSGAALYAGADNTELCPTRTFASEPIYAGDAPGVDEIVARRAAYFDPYHARLEEEIERVKALHGFALLLDAHSIRSVVPRFFDGRLPDLNLGTADGASCAASVQRVAHGFIGNAPGFTHIVNGRFKGGYITRHHGRPARGVHTMQLEIAQACYMDEAPPYPWDARRADALVAVLRRLVDALIDWRPV